MTGKQLHHILRLSEFIDNYIEGKPYSECLVTHNNKESLEKAKFNQYSLQEAVDLANKVTEETLNKMNSAIQNIYSDNKEFIDKILDKITIDIFKQHLNIPKATCTKKVYPTNFKHVFVTSDLHFGHNNILKYEYKRWEMMGTNEQTSMVKYITDLGTSQEEMCNLVDDDWLRIENEVIKLWIDKHDEKLIDNWNSVVSNNDIIYILGDLSFKSGLKTNEILKRLNGHKVLVKGNHENIWMDKDADLSLFDEIVDYKEFDYKNHKFVLSHYPIQCFNKANKGAIHLFGHIHSNELEYPIKNAFNVGVDVNNYSPVNIDKYISLYSEI